jgi:formylglycine-generating enzyme required for sulfatase activity/mono/diheme cytochrome c family protein
VRNFFHYAGAWAAAAIFPMAAALAQAPAVSFTGKVAPVLETNCLRCHSTAKGPNIPAFTSRKALVDAKLIVPGHAADSTLYKVLLLGEGEPHAMPPSGPRLANSEIRAMQRWIDGGAEWPDDAKLSAPAAQISGGNEREAVRLIRERILAHSRETGASKLEPYQVTIPGTTVSYSMVPVAAGSFEMGSPDSDPQHNAGEQPAHKVSVDAFWMQTHEVTWDEYRLFMFANQGGEVASKDALVDGVSRPTRPYVEMSFGMGIEGYPAISMTQHAANKYAEWLSARTGEFYRLPTEAEWEYACRAGTTTPYYFGGDASQLSDYAWYSENAQGKYQKVATKKPNPWGLYDMLGNVMEWTLDQYEPYKAGDETNPWVPSTKPYPQSVRGGSWHDGAAGCRCASRVPSSASWKRQDPQLPKSIWYHTDAQWLGFRLIRPVKVPDADAMYKYWNNGVEHDEQ